MKFVSFHLAIMSSQVKSRYLRIIENAIVCIRTEAIIPAMLFKRLGRLSLYIEQYYVVNSRKIILIVEPIFDPCSRFIMPSWNSTLINCILQRLTITTLVFGENATFVRTFMARYMETTEFLQEFAFAIEDGCSSNQDINLSFLFVNFAYGNAMETTFYAPH